MAKVSSYNVICTECNCSCHCDKTCDRKVGIGMTDKYTYCGCEKCKCENALKVSTKIYSKQLKFPDWG